MQQVIERGADLFEPVEPPPDGDITFKEAKALAQGQMTLAGNIEAHLLINGTSDEIREAVAAAFEGGKERMILSQSAALTEAVLTKKTVENFHAMIDAWETLSVQYELILNKSCFIIHPEPVEGCSCCDRLSTIGYITDQSLLSTTQ